MAAAKHITLGKLQTLIRRRLEEAMPLPCWVTAEISELKVNYSGHCYMELIEKGGANAVPSAKAQAVIWRNNFGMISSFFRSETGTELAVGMNVLMKVSVSYHELYGLSLVVSDIDPLYTLGDIERQRQKTIAQLRADGIYDMNREAGIPVVVQRVAVVSSRQAAGYQDFMNELALSPYHFRVELFDAFMQGHGAEDSVVDALGRICDRMEEFDAVVVIRGGGSQSDLSAFDSYRLCCHVAQFPLPVITGIGHDKDESVADLVAAVSLKTPTAVAGYLVEGMERVDSWLSSAGAELIRRAVGVVEEENRWLRDATFRLSGLVGSLTRSAEMKLEKLASGIAARSEGYFTRHNVRLDLLRAELQRSAWAALSRESARVEAARRLVASRDPAGILALGFALVRKDGAVVGDQSEVRAGDLLEITLHKGTVAARVEEKKKSK